ncbi:MAG: hypothetical protein AAGC79_09810 [Pseudomonadota bacterium]
MRQIDYGQLPEIIYVDGVLFSLFSMPLLPWLEAQEPECRFDLRTPQCARGYVGKWAVDEDKLLLIGLHAWREGKYTGVRALFGAPEIPATWFTGPLMIEPTAGAVREGEYPKARALEVRSGLLSGHSPSNGQ